MLTHANHPPLSVIGHLIGGRYRLQRQLGAGAGGIVYLATNVLNGAEIALKILPTGASNRDEFLVARTLRHPFVVSTRDFGRVDDEREFVVMDLVHGDPVDQWMRDQPLEAKLRVAVSAAFAVGHLHSRGLIHADIKPDNILVEPAAEGPEARLIDFGLSIADSEGFKGTPAYGAPELFQGAAATAATDVYALGVTLYTLFSGENPFEAPTVAETSARHQSLQPLPLPHLSKQLNQVIARCISKSVESRYPDADKLLFALADAAPEIFDSFDMGRQIQPEGLPLIERGEVLTQLREILQSVADGPTRISAPKHAGRTRLLDALYSEARLAGRRALWLDGGAEGPLSAQLACQLQPADDAQDLSAGCEGVPALIEALSAEPTVLIIDDLDLGQSGDQCFTAALCRQLRPEMPLWIFYSAAPSACREYDVLNPPGHTYRLAPLSPDGIGAALKLALGNVDSDGRLARLCHAATEGLPGRLWQLIHHQIDEGALWWGEGRWRLDDRLLLTEPADLLPPDGDTPALPPLRDLDAGERGALRSMATLCAAAPGTPLKKIIVERALSAPQRRGLKALIERQLVTDRGETLRLSHRGHIEPLLATLTEAQAQRAHRKAAALYAKLAPEARPQWAHHLAASGQLDAARALMAEDARLAQSQGLPLKAAHRHRWLIRHGGDPATHHEAAGDCELLGGHHQQALDHYRSALAADAPAPRLWCKIGWARIESGASDEGVTDAEHAVQVATAADDDEALFTAQLNLGWLLMLKGRYEEAQGYADAAAEARPALLSTATWSPLSRLNRLQGTIAWHQGDARLAERCFREGVELGTLRREPAAVAECWMGLGTALQHQKGQVEASFDALQEAILRNEAMGRLAHCAKSLNNLGISQYLKGRLSDAEQSWARFRDICSRTRDLPDLVMAHNNLGFLHKDRGDLERSAAELDRGRAVAEEIGFTRGLMMILGNLGEVRGAQGQLELGRLYLEEARRLAVDLSIKDEALEASRRLIRIRLAEGAPALALEEIKIARKTAQDLDAGEELAHLCQLEGEAIMALGDPQRAASILARNFGQFTPGTLDAARAALSLARSTSACPEGLVLNLLHEARDVATRIGASDSLISEFDDQIRQLRQARAGATQGHQILEIARRLGEMTSLDTMLPALAGYGVKLTGAERGMVLLYDRRGGGFDLYADPETLKSGADLNYSSTIADRVRSTGEAMLGNNLEGVSSASILAQNIRAVVCVPLITRGTTIGVLYVDSTQGNLACEEYRDLLEMLARQSAITVNNVWLLEDARRAEEARANALNNVSHELRTPLNGILGSAGQALDHPGLPPEVRQALQIIMDCGEALTGQLHNLLDLAAIQRGQGHKPLNPVALDLHQLPGSVLRVIQETEAARGLQIKALIAPDVPQQVEVDKDRLRQILLHLLSNAVKFTPAGGTVEIFLSLAEARAGEALIRFAVRDTGIGIPLQSIGDLFKPFTQVDMSSTRTQGGSGLGLYLAKNQVEQMGGEIGVVSVPGEGSTFWFTCVVKADVRPPEKIQAPLAPPPALACLVIEDNPINQKVARRLLERQGYTVTTADNGALGVEAFQAGDFDVVLMDCQMPVMNGFDATRAIRQLGPKGAAVPIIAVTANVTPEDKSQSLLAGMDDFLSKPINKGQLMESITQQLEARKQG